VDIPDIPLEMPEILIGLEHVKLMLAYQIREGSWSEPIAVKTRIGWAIYGGRADDDVNQTLCHVCECSLVDDKLDDLMRDFQTTESFGVENPARKLASRDDERALEVFNSTIKLENNRYEVGLLWKHSRIVLPDNKALAYRRLICFEQKLRKDNNLLKAVCDKIKSHKEQGYLVRAEPDEIEKFVGRKWFLQYSLCRTQINHPKFVWCLTPRPNTKKLHLTIHCLKAHII
jgi:hypothetical protein